MRSADAYPFPTFSAPLRFSFAIGSIAVVFLVSQKFALFVDDASLFLLLGIAVMATAWTAGTGPALLASVAAALLGASDAERAGIAGHTHLALLILQGLLLTAVISELRRARRIAEMRANEAHEARLDREAANRMKDEFLATVSHELRTPLNAMLGWVHLLRSGKLDAGASSRGLESIARNAQLQAQLTADLLDVSQALTGRLRIESRPVSLVDAAREARNAAAPAARAKSVEIGEGFPDSPVVVLGDPARLRQIVWHLLANAIKFTPRGSKISVTVDAAGDQARVTVEDSGPGIPAGFIAKLFDRFTQVDASPTRMAGGLGVGLALVRDLVEMHGGEIVAHNRNSGGAVFIASFPLRSAAELKTTRSDRAASSETMPLDGVRVLVLDHDSEGREIVETVLRQSGAVEKGVASIGEALEWLEAWRPDVLVAEDGTSEEDHYLLVGRVRTLDADQGGRIPAVALTSVARTDPHVRQMLGDTVVDVPKPVDSALLTSAVARLAGRVHRANPS
jgi:signal transduction histidine kinase